jgi:hypothetical protein
MPYFEMRYSRNGALMIPKLTKKLKIVLGIGVVGLILSGAFALYLGVVGVKYVASVATDPKIVEHAETLLSKVDQIPTSGTVRCLSVAQSFMDLENFLSTPLSQNLQALKHACFATPEKGDLI